MSQKIASFFAPCLIVLCILPATALAGTYTQNNLVSDLPGMAAVTDPNLRNPWGISFSASSPLWISDQAANVSTLYSASGTPNSLVVSVPGGPTGTVFNSAGAGNFLAGGGNAANFLFATLGGSIYAWNGGNGTTAQLGVSVAGASFTGLAIDSNASGNFLYAANPTASTGGIDVFNSSFAQVNLAGGFVDPNLPTGFEPYNIQAISGLLYVEYTNTANPRVLGAGVVSVFDANGSFLRELIGPGGQLDDPWGVTMAPANFGSFSNDLLVGNLGNGEINAYDPTTGAFLGTLTGPGGTPLVNQDLWALAVSPTNPNAVYFTAGINGQRDGLFGDIVATPEPGSLALVGLTCLALIAKALSSRDRRERSPVIPPNPKHNRRQQSREKSHPHNHLAHQRKRMQRQTRWIEHFERHPHLRLVSRMVQYRLVD
jgi:uncharacterized protein (TIGR03118 family)